MAQTSFIADPVIGVLQEGILLDVRPIVSADGRFITLETRTATTALSRPIEEFTTYLGQAVGLEPGLGQPSFVPKVTPVTIQIPELEITSTESTSRIPDGGSIMLSGLKTIISQDKQSTTPILGNIPILGFLFSRKGKSEETLHSVAIITASIIDLNERQ